MSAMDGKGPVVNQGRLSQIIQCLIRYNKMPNKLLTCDVHR